MYFDNNLAPRLLRYSIKRGVDVNLTHIRQQLLDATMSFGLLTKNATIVGVILFVEVRNFFTPTKGMHVVFCDFDSGHGLYKYVYELFDELAEFFEYSYISANTVRTGWTKRNQPGWEQTDYLWSKKYGQR